VHQRIHEKDRPGRRASLARGSWPAASPPGGRPRGAEAGLGIELRFLPAACPELNPVEGLWRCLKGRVLADEPTPDVEASVQRAFEDLLAMGSQERLTGIA